MRRLVVYASAEPSSPLPAVSPKLRALLAYFGVNEVPVGIRSCVDAASMPDGVFGARKEGIQDMALYEILPSPPPLSPPPSRLLSSVEGARVEQGAEEPVDKAEVKLNSDRRCARCGIPAHLASACGCIGWRASARLIASWPMTPSAENVSNSHSRRCGTH
ncbi:hypothetical protein AB1Y20_012841 [Prymnesium parvum]|uniref:Uncharacterized protein n=1 Tax=Prymnesium parvum TaxID=97485 RepID=A0AB34ILN7_PRYPA